MKKFTLIFISLFGIFTIINAQNNCLPFNGIDDYVNCGSGLNITGTIISIEAWIYPTDFKTNSYDNTIAGNNYWATYEQGYVFCYGNSTGELDFSFGYYTGSGYAWATTGVADALTLNTWQHVAAVYNGSTVKIYVNGIEKVSQSRTETILASSQPFLIASCPGDPNNRLMVGKIDGLRIWNVERTATEIDQYMYIELAGTETGLQAYYNFNQTSGLTLYDATSNNNDGTLTNMTGNEWTATNYYGGTGTSADPYTIDNLNELHYLSGHSGDWISEFEQTTNIDATATSGWDGGAGFSPIGRYQTAFRGNYNGNNHTIDALYINRPASDYIGLFGDLIGNQTNTIQNLGVTNVNITGNSKVGALLGAIRGYNNTYNFTNCYSSGSIISYGQHTGGLIGHAGCGVIQRCYSSCSITANSNLNGGLAGSLGDYGIISECYATGNINGNYNVGGLVGINFGEIKRSYATGNVIGSGHCAGGLLGENVNAVVIYCYSTGSVSGSSDVGGLIGEVIVPATCHYSFWDTETSGQSSSAGGTGKTTAEMKRAGTFLSVLWNFTLSGNVWAMNGSDNSGYPWLRSEGYTPSHIWLGTGGTSWATAGNWSENSEPSSVKNIIVPDITNDPIVSNLPASPATGNNLTIESGGNLTINAGKALTGNGNLSNSGTFTINSDAINGTGSLIVSGTSIGDVIFKRHVDEAAKGDKWHYVSSPVAGQVLDDTWMTNNSIAVSNTYKQFFLWDEPTNYWIIYGDALFSDNTFVEAHGYCLTRSGAGELSFTGTVRTADVTYAATHNSGQGDGFNLVGNPFTSSIGVTNSATTTGKFLADNTVLLDDSYEALYIWDEQTGYQYGDNDYKVICNAGYSGFGSNSIISQDYISPGQAFMVKVASDGNLAFNENMQVHNNATFYKNDEDVWPSVELIVENTELFNSTAICFNENMTIGLDPSYDAGKLKGNPDIALYTKLIEDNGVDFTIQALPYFEEDYSVKVGLDVTNTGEYTFKAATMEQIPEEVYIYFEDKLTATVTNLKETDNYTCVISEAGSITNRFVLHFTLTPFSTDEINANQSNIQIWSANKAINIFNPENLKGQIRIINMYGQKLIATSLNGDDKQQITINVPAGNYVVNIVDDSFSVSKKVFIGN